MKIAMLTCRKLKAILKLFTQSICSNNLLYARQNVIKQEENLDQIICQAHTVFIEAYLLNMNMTTLL